MNTYAIWNNKGGTGKTSLSFQIICSNAAKHGSQKNLVIDLCPQANLSELFLGGITGDGGKHLYKLFEGYRKTIGGYFQIRFNSPFSAPTITPNDYITTPNDFNKNIPENIDLVAGDQIVEIQNNAISTLANTQLPNTNTWIAVIDWVKDLIAATSYDNVFIDLNPSFSIYTQIGLATCGELIIPVMADDSSRRAVNNVLSLIYGIAVSQIYQQYSFSTKMHEAKRGLPKIKCVINNRLTRYVGAASAYKSVLNEIEKEVKLLANKYPEHFIGGEGFDTFIDVRDFGITGVASFAQGCPFYRLRAGKNIVAGEETALAPTYIEHCVKAIDAIVNII